MLDANITDIAFDRDKTIKKVMKFLLKKNKKYLLLLFILVTR